MTHFERPAQFEGGYPYAPATARTQGLAVLALLAVLMAYAVGFVVLYPAVSRSVAESASEGNDPTLLQFVGP
ncbi:MAG TPA: hypothetical protein VLI91_03375 [Roseiarcus sp.]|nr:hypothetical protein [Roseiarcus sp.]